MTPSARLDEAGVLSAAAARDRAAFAILSRDVAAPAEVALFLAQQSIEKAFKAALGARGVIYRRTHDLLLLNELAKAAGLAPPLTTDLLTRLGPYAVEFRYLGAIAPHVTIDEARAAIDEALAWSAAVIASVTPP